MENQGQSGSILGRRGLFDPPERSKRLRKSRLIVIDGHAVLKGNNYGLEDGFISVFDNRIDEIQTGVESSANNMSSNSEYIVTASGKVVNTRKDPRKHPLKPVLKKERIVDPVTAAHLLELKKGKEANDLNRLQFIAANFDAFEPFLSNTFRASVLGCLSSVDAGAASSSANQSKTASGNNNLLKQFAVDIGEEPSCLNASAVTMRDYQVVGVNFMLKKFSQGMSCILADEMGLGKTIQTIAFLGTLKFYLNISGPHLIVVPMSVLSNWISEFKRFCPRLNIVRYHVSDLTEKTLMRHEILSGAANGTVDVVVTTYEMLVSENGCGIAQVRYRYLVLDEAHKVKNSETTVSAACKRVTRELSLFLTGTPVQNNLKECWSLLNCMQPDVFQNGDMVDNAFDAGDMQRTNLGVVDKVWKLLQLLVLRRKKSELDMKLPSKVELRLLCPLSTMQTFWYKRLLIMNAKSLVTGANDFDSDPPSSSSSSALVSRGAPKKGAIADESTASASAGPKNKLNNLIMQLRKVSNHPFLFPHIETLKEENELKDYIEASGKLRMLQRLLVTLKGEGHRVVIFSQFTSMLNIIEDFLELLGPEYSFLRLDGSTNRVQRMVNIGRFNAPNSSIFIFLLSTRAGGLGVNLQTADTCILFDSDWNPQADIQAMGRVHRIGQTKPVTIYRLVSADTVEERIVARAARKLVLDEMVSSGSAQTLGISEANNEDSNGGEGDDEDENGGASASDMKKALMFTMRRMFQAGGGHSLRINLDDSEDKEALSDERLDRLISAARQSTIAGNLTSIAPTNDDVNPDEEGNDKCFSLKSADCNTRVFQGEDFSLASLYKGKSLNDIRKEWEERENLKLAGSKREQQSRFVTMDAGKGMGRVRVLKNNMYSLNDGEPSVFIREAASAGSASAASQPKRTSSLIAGRDYQNLDFCQGCGQGGDLVLCDGCPMSFHATCLGYKSTKIFHAHLRAQSRSISRAGKFTCPHHSCVGCGKTTARAGHLLMRCFGCSAAYCEDCANFEGVGGSEALVVIPEQPPLPLQQLGFWKCFQAVYVYCSSSCAVSGQHVYAGYK